MLPLPLLEARLSSSGILRRAHEIRLLSQVSCRLRKTRRPYFQIRRQFRSERSGSRNGDLTTTPTGRRRRRRGSHPEDNDKRRSWGRTTFSREGLRPRKSTAAAATTATAGSKNETSEDCTGLGASMGVSLWRGVQRR